MNNGPPLTEARDPMPKGDTTPNGGSNPLDLDFIGRTPLNDCASQEWSL